MKKEVHTRTNGKAFTGSRWGGKLGKKGCGGSHSVFLNSRRQAAMLPGYDTNISRHRFRTHGETPGNMARMVYTHTQHDVTHRNKHTHSMVYTLRLLPYRPK